jgi:hypothetical protein
MVVLNWTALSSTPVNHVFKAYMYVPRCIISLKLGFRTSVAIFTKPCFKVCFCRYRHQGEQIGRFFLSVYRAIFCLLGACSHWAVFSMLKYPKFLCDFFFFCTIYLLILAKKCWDLVNYIPMNSFLITKYHKCLGYFFSYVHTSYLHNYLLILAKCVRQNFGRLCLVTYLVTLACTDIETIR